MLRSKTTKCGNAVMYVFAARGGALNWGRDILPALEGMGVEPVTWILHSLEKKGILTRVGPDTYCLLVNPFDHASDLDMLENDE